MKTGIVLGGGGAKGAYSFGFIKKIKEAGFKVDAISGTSVGGLNAFLFATDSLIEDKQLWDNIEQKKIYPYKFGKLFSLIIGAWILLSNIFFNYFYGSLPQNLLSGIDKIYKYVARGFASIFILSLPFYYIKYHTIHYLYFLVLVIIIFNILQSKIRSITFEKRTSLIFFLIFSILYIINAKNQVTFLDRFLFYLFIIIDSLIIVFSIPFYFSWFTIFINKPLIEKIKSLAQNSFISIPTYITTGFSQIHITPFKNNIYIGKSARKEVIGEAAFFPKYENLQHKTFEEVVKTLSETAALPLGLVNNGNHLNDKPVDGGIVDNIPVLPLIKFENCDYLVVVALSELGYDELLNGHFNNLSNLDILNFNDTIVDKSKESILQIEQNKYMELQILDRRKIIIKIITPDQSLGGWIKGTLNFNPLYSQRLQKLGEQAAEKFINEYKNGDIGTEFQIATPKWVNVNN